ncbi:MAG: hypothetical protein LBE56_06120 [Tannerella sp.]|nr:hypothetical protein [Tannerella sp.]
MINIEQQIKKDPVSGKRIFYFSSSNIWEQIEYVNEEKITHIELNPYVVEFFEVNIDFLKQVQNLENLSIVGLRKIDVTCINKLKSLSSLYLDMNDTRKIDFSNMNLRELNIRYSSSMTGISSLKQLSSLIISNAESSFFSLELFSALKKLKNLEIIQSNIPLEFIYLTNNLSLKELSLIHIKKNFTLNYLEKINLKILKIENCKKVEIQNVANLIQLEEFMLVDSAVISDNNIFLNLKKLKSLIVLGSSFFCDGNLFELQNRLEYLGIDNKKHYNIKFKRPHISL